MNCNLHFQTLLTAPGALMETIPMAIHSIEPYHAGQSNKISAGELIATGSARDTKLTKQQNLVSLQNVSSNGWLSQLFLVLTIYNFNFFLTQLY